MKIGELAGATGVEVDTIRYYEREGLLKAPERDANGYRRYGEAHLERLAFIRHCRALDIPLSEIKQLLTALDRPGRSGEHIDRLIAGHLERVRARLRSLRALERQLARLAAQCDEGGGSARCGILSELVSAAHGEACACHPKPAPDKRRAG